MLFLILTSALLLFRTLAYPTETARTVQDACRLFVVAVLPPLFAFSVAARILVRVGFCALLARSPLGAAFSLLGVSRGGGAALAVGLLSGFPTGASVLAELCERGEMTREEAARLLPFCNNASASFVIGTVGASLFGSASLGRVLFLSQTAAVFLALGLFGKPFTRQTVPVASEKRSAVSVFVSSVTQSASAMAAVCGYVVVFSVLSDALAAPFPPSLRAALRGLLEVSGGVSALEELALPHPLGIAACAGMLGFGGICVFLQAADRAALAEIPLSFYFGGKALCALFGAFLAPLFDALSRTPFPAVSQIGVFVVIFTIAGVKNKIFFKKSVEKRKRMLYNRNENHCP